MSWGRECQCTVFDRKKGVDKGGRLWYDTQALRVRLKYRGVEQLEARRAHNPEVVGSSPASATIKSPEILRFQDFFLLFRGKKLEDKFCDFVENR